MTTFIEYTKGSEIMAAIKRNEKNFTEARDIVDATKNSIVRDLASKQYTECKERYNKLLHADMIHRDTNELTCVSQIVDAVNHLENEIARYKTAIKELETHGATDLKMLATVTLNIHQTDLTTILDSFYELVTK